MERSAGTMGRAESLRITGWVAGEDGEGTITACVANDDYRPYPLRTENEGGDEPGVMDFTGHGEEAVVEAPDPDEVLDLSEMREGSGRRESV
ncbi:hypothetical protein ACGRHY_08510 [Streptomyces sp. HK10]|uniref:hypothetical protein n=1 Tax=Streptomyces sp. HK10 TaxID=3373255 RepID=UPI003749C3B0